MKARSPILSARRRSRLGVMLPLILFGAALLPQSAHASLFHGETLDSIANGISWVVLVIAPIIGITVFWLVHVMPEKIARKEKASTDARDSLPLSALALLWRIALANCMALGIHQAGTAQAGLRHRCG